MPYGGTSARSSATEGKDSVSAGAAVDSRYLVSRTWSNSWDLWERETEKAEYG